MDVKEMRIALSGYCKGRNCKTCVLCEKHNHNRCPVFDGGWNFDVAPDEMIYKWHAIVSPELAIKEEPVIKDSGQRRVFETGATRDCAEGKGRFDLLPWAALLEVAKHAENGSKKYGEHNVDKGLPTSSFLDSAIRHIGKHLAGWTDEPHLEAAAWNCLWAVEMTLKHPELVDTPWMPEMDGAK